MSDRVEVSISHIQGKDSIEIKDYDRFEALLYNDLYVPSYVHSYSLAIEYMKKWFESKFDKRFFKYQHVNGKHLFDDYKRFNKQNIVREKPLYIVTPNPEFDYDRESLDLYMAPPDIFLKRSDYQRSFFKDYQRQLYLGFQMKELKMTFNFRVKVSTRAQQLDVAERMNLIFRIGATQTEYITGEYVIPREIMIAIAIDSGFEVEKGQIKNPTLFLQYLNSKSDIPIIYKLRNINNQLEYYMRLKDVYCNIWTTNKLQLDDGERIGMIDDNFNIDMEVTLRMAIPHFFVYFHEKPLTYKIPLTEKPYEEGKPIVGLYTLSQFKINPTNEYGWNTKINTTYQLDPGESIIDISPILNGTELDTVITDELKNYRSPQSFIDIKIYKEVAGEYPIIDIDIDWENRSIRLNNVPKDKEYIYIVIYIDTLYFNQRILDLKKIESGNRIL